LTFRTIVDSYQKAVTHITVANKLYSILERGKSASNNLAQSQSA